MTAFTNLKEEEITAILTYIKDVKPPVAAVTKTTEENGEEKSTNTWLYLLIAVIILYLLSGVLGKVQHTLARTVRHKEGIPEPPQYKGWKKFYEWARMNKKLLAVILILLIVWV